MIRFEVVGNGDIIHAQQTIQALPGHPPLSYVLRTLPMFAQFPPELRMAAFREVNTDIEKLGDQLAEVFGNIAETSDRPAEETFAMYSNDAVSQLFRSAMVPDKYHDIASTFINNRITLQGNYWRQTVGPEVSQQLGRVAKELVTTTAERDHYSIAIKMGMLALEVIETDIVQFTDEELDSPELFSFETMHGDHSDLPSGDSYLEIMETERDLSQDIAMLYSELDQSPYDSARQWLGDTQIPRQ
jgi:hypothetical protein